LLMQAVAAVAVRVQVVQAAAQAQETAAQE
jgi:hypothetical protein